MPSVIQHYKKAEATSRLKKFVSAIEQAIVLSEVENGDISEWTQVSTQYDEAGNYDFETNGQISKEFFMTYLAPYFKYTSFEDAKTHSYPTVHLADGSSFSLKIGYCYDIQFDTNGSSKPNVIGRDKFAFFFCPATTGECGSSRRFCTPNYNNTTREQILTQCKNNPYHCSHLLEHDNWEFKSDYPYRL